MKGPRFNAKVTKANQASDQLLASMVANMRRRGDGEIPEKVVMEVLRPFHHLVNWAAEENADPADLIDALPPLVASMFGYLTVKSCSKDMPSALAQKYILDFVDDVTRAVVGICNEHFTTKFATQPVGGKFDA